MIERNRRTLNKQRTHSRGKLATRPWSRRNLLLEPHKWSISSCTSTSTPKMSPYCRQSWTACLSAAASPHASERRHSRRWRRRVAEPRRCMATGGYMRLENFSKLQSECHDLYIFVLLSAMSALFVIWLRIVRI